MTAERESQTGGVRAERGDRDRGQSTAQQSKEWLLKNPRHRGAKRSGWPQNGDCKTQRAAGSDSAPQRHFLQSVAVLVRARSAGASLRDVPWEPRVWTKVKCDVSQTTVFYLFIYSEAAARSIP